jgi:hypothetical protein
MGLFVLNTTDAGEGGMMINTKHRCMITDRTAGTAQIDLLRYVVLSDVAWINL